MRSSGTELQVVTPASRSAAPLAPSTVAPDASIVARLLAGDHDGIRAAYDRYASQVYRVARRVTCDRSLAEDVVQEVFVRLWGSPASVDLARGSLGSFLMVMAHRRAIDLVRNEASRAARHASAGGTVCLAARPAVDDIAREVVDLDEARIRTQAVARAMVMLPESQRVAVQLAYFEGCSYREVATRLCIPEGTAKSRIRSALMTLRGQLEESWAA